MGRKQMSTFKVYYELYDGTVDTDEFDADDMEDAIELFRKVASKSLAYYTITKVSELREVITYKEEDIWIGNQKTQRKY